MRLYLDDDVAGKKLIKLLEDAGHDVLVHPDAGRPDSLHDAEHFLLAIKDERVLLTGNYKDFDPVAELVVQSGGTHPGVLTVRRDGHARNMTPGAIVSAIGIVEKNGHVTRDRNLVLNHYRN